MADMKLPGPDHPITIEPNPNKVIVRVDGEVMADSKAALTLREGHYPPVFYIPRADVQMRRLVRTDHASHCPYKGDAAYYSITTDGGARENAVWTYETPYPAVREIAGYLAFYPNRVDSIEEHPIRAENAV